MMKEIQNLKDNIYMGKEMEKENYIVMAGMNIIQNLKENI